MLRDASIRTKVLAVAMIVTTVALILTSSVLLAWDYYQFRTDIAQELSTQARIVLENSTAAMSFQDQAAARETIDTLSPNEHIALACLYNAAGDLFVQFTRPEVSGTCPEDLPPYDLQFGSNHVEVVARTQVAGRPGGSIYLESDLDAVSGRVRVQTLTLAMVLGVALLVAFILSTVLQRIISEPLDALAVTAREVSTRNDYSLRARKTTGDELGMLVDAFNRMLSQIERAEQERAGLLMREREANRLKDEFLMTLSHELRTPLNAIQGWTRMLISHVIPPEGIEKALQKIERNAQAQARLVEDLLDISRFTTGKFRLEVVAVDLVAVANQAIETVRPEAEARRITITRRFEAASVPMTGDPDRLQQVIWNLLTNAVKFSAVDSHIVVSIEASGEACELRVQDRGTGIDPAFLPFVFEPFRQADASMTRARGGLGLGLSIVQRIVHLHGGEIRADSDGPGQGATFVVRLPVVSNAAGLPAPVYGSDPPPAPGGLDGVRILVLDDDGETAELLFPLLRATGARVEIAGAISEALRLSRQTMPDILISDIARPDRDGYTLLRQLRSEFGRTAPRVAIALTAQAARGDHERALEAGFDRHVVKPVDPIQFVELLREVLAASAL